MRALVTGAAGLTGGEVVRSLRARDVNVLALVRGPNRRAAVPADVECAIGDCADVARMDELLRGCDALVHVAGIQLGMGLARVPSIRALAQVVAVSSAGIHSRHRGSASAYRANEDALRAANPRLVVVRPTMIYGSPRDRNVHHVIAFVHRYGALPLFGDGGALLQPVHYEDLAAAIAALLQVEGPISLDAGGEAPVSLREAGEAIFRCLGRPPRFIRVPYGLAHSMAAAADRLRGTRWRERVERTLEDRSVDNEPLIGSTGVRPRSFQAGVRAEVTALGLAPAAA